MEQQLWAVRQLRHDVNKQIVKPNDLICYFGGSKAKCGHP